MGKLSGHWTGAKTVIQISLQTGGTYIEHYPLDFQLTQNGTELTGIAKYGALVIPLEGDIGADNSVVIYPLCEDGSRNLQSPYKGTANDKGDRITGHINSPANLANGNPINLRGRFEIKKSSGSPGSPAETVDVERPISRVEELALT